MQREAEDDLFWVAQRPGELPEVFASKDAAYAWMVKDFDKWPKDSQGIVAEVTRAEACRIIAFAAPE